MHASSHQELISRARSITAFALSLAIIVFAALAPRQSLAADLETVGDAVCNRCHSDQVDTLKLSVHSKTEHFGQTLATCESCHGPGRKHAKSELESDIINPAQLKGADASKTCLTCHTNSRTFQHWPGSAHKAADVGCTGCHKLHGQNKTLLAAATEVETCINCHRKQRASLTKRSTHQLRDAIHSDGSGKMTCTSCHGPHGTVAEKLVDANSVNDKCYECHQEKKAPVLWEHSIVKENCLACHNPHGSNHEMMLTAKQPRLCQQCHEQGRHQTVAGQPNSFLVMNRGCSNCHASIHGTNNPSGLKLKN